MAHSSDIHDIEWYADVPRSIWMHAAIGFGLIALLFGGFGTWAATAPLAAAVITQGSFVATGHNTIVQHLEGGVIEEIFVNEGDKVRAGQPLIRLDQTAATVKKRQFFLRRARLEAVVARLRAEEMNLPEVAFPAVITGNMDDAGVSAIVEEQRENFASSREKLRYEILLLEHNIEALRFRKAGYEDLARSIHAQRAIMKEEHAAKSTLLDKGLLRATEIKTIERAMADAEGNIGRLNAEISETETQIRKQQEQIAHTKRAYRQAALDNLQSFSAELETVREQVREAENVLERATIAAPVSGIVVHMHYRSIGGVIESGKPILEILPSDVPLIIETQVRRTEIDSVRIGQTATLRLTALNQRTTPVLYGQVDYISADSLPDVTGGKRDIYVARISLDAAELDRIPGFSPPPGMPVEIMIQTAERTFLNYLIKPIEDSMSRAFMEE
jgi:HlyD family type I secretion membrane fusion protein